MENNFESFQQLADFLNKEYGNGNIIVDPKNPTYEGQQLVNRWLDVNKKTPQNPDGYDVPEGGFTDRYIKAETTPPADTLPETEPATPDVVTPHNTSADFARAQGEAHNEGRLYSPTEKYKSAPTPEPTKENILKSWTPHLESFSNTAGNIAGNILGASGSGMLMGQVDPSGAAAGMRTGSAITQNAAAEQAKIEQWNKQRATDETLADKIAAAQASGKWRQNANALGAEGGASVVAAQNEAITPDIMSQKQYQSQSMNTAGQAMEKATEHKLESNNYNTNANVEDYSTAYENAKNNQAANLANARVTTSPTKNKAAESTDKTEEPQNTTPTASTQESKTENTEQADQGPKAETNQQANKTDTASEIVADNQQIEEYIHRAEGINTERKNGQVTPEQEKEYLDIEEKFNKLAEKMGGAPRSLPPLYDTSKDITSQGAIAEAINDRTQ